MFISENIRVNNLRLHAPPLFHTPKMWNEDTLSFGDSVSLYVFINEMHLEVKF